MSGDILEEEARFILATEKFILDDITGEPSPQHSTQMVFTSNLCDIAGTTIAGLTVELAFRVPPRFEDCKYTFTIFTFRPGGKKRAYQLEVIPEEDRGHNDERGRIYGPHHHIGTKVEAIRIENLGCKDHEKWFRIFLTNANVQFSGRYFGPFDGSLFREV